MKTWHRFISSLEEILGKKTVNQWVRPFRILEFDARNIHLEAKDSFQILWFKEHISSKAEKLLLKSDGKPIKLHFYLEGQLFNSKTHSLDEKPKEKVFPPDSLHSHATFDQFFTGTEKFLALEILRKTGKKEHGAPIYNPIYIYGPKGVGKTHLLMGTAHHLINQNTRAIYVHSDTFTEHVIRAFRESSLLEFRNSYRDIETLIIDDIHLLARKSATQEELFHTFNRLHIAEVQIIFSGNCPPNQLKSIEDRLISRFEWGLTLSLTPPTYAAKKSILTKKIQSFSLSLDPSTLEFLLKTFQNLHTLIRAVDALTLRSHDSKISLDLEVVKVLLKDLIERENLSLLSPEKILKAVAENFGIKIEDILGRSQIKEFSLPRQISMYLCRKELSTPYLKIGQIFSRDHSTVISSVKRIDHCLVEKNIQVCCHVRRILQQIQS